MADTKVQSVTPQPPSVPVEELLANAGALFSYGPEVLQGALYGSGKTELTVDEARLLIEGFLRKKVE